MASSIQQRNLDKLLSNQSEDLTGQQSKCMFCCKEDRIQSFYELAKGDHIKQPGENLSFNIGKSLKRLYDHHAIVKEIHEILCNGSRAILTLIEFNTSPFNATPKVQEQTVIKDLQHDEIVLIKYQHKIHSPDEIIQRGQSVMEMDLSYSLLCCNCEHIARWCVCGNRASFQAKGFFELVRMSSNVLNNHLLKAIFMTTDDALLAGEVSLAGPLLALAGIIIHQFLQSILDTRLLNILLENQNICNCCYKRKKREAWAKFGIVALLQGGGLFLTSFIPFLPLQIIFGIIFSSLTIYIKSKVKDLMKKICSPFVGSKNRICSFDEISIGDIVSWKACGLYHDGVVTSMSIIPNSRCKKANLRIIYYQAPGFFVKGNIVEETLSFDLEKDEPRKHDYTGYDINEPDVVVERARKRLGETKFSLTHRSAHFCHWAKLQDEKDFEEDNANNQNYELTYLRPFNPDSNDYKLIPLTVNHHRTKPIIGINFFQIKRPHTSMDIEMVKAKICDDIQSGQLIQFTYRSLPHRAVCTNVKAGCRPSIINVDVVHYGVQKVATEETFTFDLNKVDVTIIKVHPIYRYNKKDIVRRAWAKVGERRYSLLCRRSSHLAEEIVYKNVDKRIDSFSEVKPGDCIIYRYWGLLHEAVIVHVTPAKSTTEGHLTFVHYAWDRPWRTRYIKEEEKFFNLFTDKVVLKAFPGYVLYPDNVVVQRALSRVGERNFHIRGNISSDVVHWAKVVQTPSIVTITNNSEPVGSITGGETKQFLLIPAVGEHYKTNFEKDWIKTWDEAIPGIIVGKGSEIGILSSVDIGKKELTIIGKKRWKLRRWKGEIREISIKLDLRSEFLDVYRCDPRYSNPPAVSLRKAMQHLASKLTKTNWSFCEECVLRKDAEK